MFLGVRKLKWDKTQLLKFHLIAIGYLNKMCRVGINLDTPFRVKFDCHTSKKKCVSEKSTVAKWPKYEGFCASNCAICTGLTKAMFQKGVEDDDYQVELRGSMTTSILVLL